MKQEDGYMNGLLTSTIIIGIISSGFWTCGFMGLALEGVCVREMSTWYSVNSKKMTEECPF